MREGLLKKVAEKETLAILTGSLESVIWKSNENPVATMYSQYFEHQFFGIKVMVPYASQAGIAMGIMAGRIPIRGCHGVRMSEGGLGMFREAGVAATYAELIPLVKSLKDDTKVCPIEQFLYDHGDQGKQWEFLRERFRKNRKSGTGGVQCVSSVLHLLHMLPCTLLAVAPFSAAPPSAAPLSVAPPVSWLILCPMYFYQETSYQGTAF